LEGVGRCAISQHDYNLANATGASFRADANLVLGAIAGNNSGATTPATTFSYQWWADTTTGLLKIRNAANSAWVTVGTLATANFGFQVQDADLDALAALGSTGIAVRSAADTWVQRTIAVGSAKLTVVNGDGVAGNPTLDAAAASETQAGAIEISTQAEADAGTDDVRAVTALKLRTTPKILLGTEVAASGTGFSVATGIPSWARRVTVNFIGVSTNGTAKIVCRIGPSGGVETSGYTGQCLSIDTTPTVNNFAASAWFPITLGAAAVDTVIGKLVLDMEDAAANTWNATIQTQYGTTICLGCIHKSLAGALSQIDMGTDGGANTFDSGSVNISYE